MKSEEVKKIILTSFHEKKNSHAFLLVTNNIENCLNDIISIVKSINCKNKGNDKCDCNICTTINAITNPDFIIVRPDGKEIKKDQILNIIDTFSTKPLINKYSIYVVTDADKMNDSSANKILKFLEEPEENIVGFFITDKLQGVIPTIKSRCEIYNYRFGGTSILDILEINEDEYASAYDISMNMLNLLNDNQKYLLMIETKNIAKKERFELDLIFNLLKKFYILKYEYILSNKYSDIESVIRIIDTIMTSDLNLIVKRIKILDNIINDLKFNVNKELIVNKFFLLWE